MRSNNFYHFGLHIEKKVAAVLQNLGWITTISPGSRGPADIHAVKNKQKWCIQVKFRGSGTGGLTNMEESRLLCHSSKSSCHPVVALVSRYPGGLLLNASNVRDKKNPFLIRKKSGRFVAIEIDHSTALFFYSLFDGTVIEP